MHPKFDFHLPPLSLGPIGLRPVNADDHDVLFQWHTDARNIHLWWADRHVLSYEQFVEDFRSQFNGYMQAFFMVDYTDADDETYPIGLVYTYNTNWIDRFTYLAVYLAPDYTALRHGPAAAYLIVKHLFAYYGFRKIYSEIYAYNSPSLKAAERYGFVEEGRLKEYRWFGDRFWDLHILSVSLQGFDEVERNYLATLTPNSKPPEAATSSTGAPPQDDPPTASEA